ncbi:MAG: MFS transporter [Waddliaceae bacterium]|nr:MFS transporter [Waddliaceae bacterium]MBT3578751.1 MFS transporter [Waddliaceae bacterium]MBT4445059.1 MFS transporter [Waddliaceae bacterium]MBT6929088.1 MFS transporter [Waddliaceae bacterium]MBT7264374.1 MFS transporter [Waddliaceae bacterium]
MASLLRSLLSPIITLSLFVLANNFFITFLSVSLNSQGVSTSLIGALHSINYAGFMFGALKSESIIRRVGHIRAFAAFACLNMSTYLVHGMFSFPVTWLAMRFCAGFTIATMFVVVESWLLSKSSRNTRGVILSIYMITLYTSQGASQYIIDIVDIMTSMPFVVAALLCSLSILPLTITRTPAPELEKAEPISLRSLLRISPFGVISCMMSGYIISTIYSFVPIFAQEKFLSVSLVMSVTIAGGFLLQWPIGKLSDIFDRRKVLTILCWAMLFPALFIIVLPSVPFLILPLSFLFGGLCFSINPVSVTQVCDHIETQHITGATSMLFVVYGFGAILGPLTTPFFVKHISPAAPYISISLGAVLLGILGLYTLKHRKPIPPEEKQDFIRSTGTSSVSYEMNPNVETPEDQNK